ncbi:MAG: FAD:protein FMN transferase [Chromatiales bacterium]|nr:FAD:protein FMN transferase [Chromatiales bacterium]
MNRARPGLAAVLAALLLGACGPAPESHRDRIHAFGTEIDVSLRTSAAAQANATFAALRRDFDWMHRTWHAWQPSELTQTNDQFASGQWFTLPPSIKPLVEASKQMYRASDGLFNPAIGALVGAWGFQRDDLSSGGDPSPTDLQRLNTPPPTMDDIEIDGERARATNPRVRLDFGGIAKGYGVELALGRVLEFGVRDALINAGGDVKVIGDAGGRPWHVGIRDPRGGVLAAIELDGGEAIFTSGTYERSRARTGRPPAHHILDPRTGEPATGLVSATVVHYDATLADAAATALIAAGPKDWKRIAARMGVALALVLDAEDTAFVTPALAPRLDWQRQPARTVIAGSE